MRRSEIFESFVKIAEEKGLVSKATPEENKADLEKTHRADSLSIDDIAHLYGVKPPAPKEVEYKRNIVEVAHPNPLVLAPSYDKLNGLVENINERQDILLHIVNKNNTGSIVQTKYAERELVLSLVRVGNEMDNRGHDELRALADVCLRQASSKTLKKQGLLGQMVLGGIVALLAGWYAKQHLPFHSDGFDIDYQKAVSELNDLITSNDNLLWGYKLTDDTIEQAHDIKAKLDQLKQAINRVMPAINNISKPRMGGDLAQMLGPIEQEAAAAYQQLDTVVKQISPYLQQVIANFQNSVYKQQHIAEKGVITQMIDATGILHGGHGNIAGDLEGGGLIADDFDDVAHALEAILKDVTDLETLLTNCNNQAKVTVDTVAANAQNTSPTKVTTPAGTTIQEDDELHTKELENSPDMIDLMEQFGS
jgi:gas vesicle protein